MALLVYHSNRLELLAAELAARLAAEPSGPLTAERIVVPHPTLGRWLRLELASALGVCCNIRTELPAEFAWSMLRAALPSLASAEHSRGHEPANLRWHLFELLPEFSRSRAGAALRDFLGDGDSRKRFEFASRLAAVYDRCLLYRPDWIQAWERGETPHWQARLWRLAGAEIRETHWVAALRDLRRQLAGGDTPEGWPRRAFVFGVAALSPSYVELLLRLGESLELHCLQLNPCASYWGDFRTRRQNLRLAAGQDPDRLHLEEGNELLAAWGGGARELLDALLDCADPRERFQPPERASRLCAVQRDIAAARLAAEAAAEEPLPGDDSLQIHCCHSPMREAEALHDRLLALFESRPEISPADVLILSPDLARYGPVAAAVFEAEGRIPVALSRARAADSPSARAFFALLELPGSRFPVEEVLAPLDAPLLRARFGLGEDSLAAIREWLAEAGIRRGVDAGDGRTEFPGHTWREGFRRLLMGYAAGDRDALVCGLAPCAIGGEGGFEAGEEDYAALGRFISYCEALFELRSLHGRERGAREWTGELATIVARFFGDGSQPGPRGGLDEARQAAAEIGELRELIEAFERQAGRARCAMPLEVVRQALLESARRPPLGPARLADGATIGSLALGQVFPAEVVCVMGMNGGEFPGNPPRHSFDPLESAPPRRGDRDSRGEQRFAFLEALLGARRAFIVTYTGRNLQDDSELPPSALVEDLADYLAARFPAPGREAGAAGEAGRAFVTEHPLQPFSERYFEPGGELFSYSASMLATALAMRRGGHSAERRLLASLPAPGAERRHASPAELESFFANPTRAFLRERLAVRLGDEGEEAFEEGEPLALDGLQKHRLREEILERGRLLEAGAGERGGTLPERLRARLLASGRLPHGHFGALALDAARVEAQALRARLLPHLATLAAAPRRVDFPVGEFRVAGWLPHVGEEAIICWRNGKRRAEDLLRMRLRQLVWSAAGNRPLPVKGFWLDGELDIEDDAPLDGELARIWLKGLLDAWWRGLCAPLRFFPRSAHAYNKKLAGPGGRSGPGRLPEEGERHARERASAAARAAWEGNPFGGAPGEGDERGNRLVWAGVHPLFDERFEHEAASLWAGVPL